MGRGAARIPGRLGDAYIVTPGTNGTYYVYANCTTNLGGQHSAYATVMVD